MTDEKDRLGSKLRDVEAAREDQWARQRDAELIQKMREKRAASLACPQCKTTLVPRARNGVNVMMCTNGHGAWLDAKSLELVGKAK